MDTLGEGIQAMTSKGIVALGQEYEVDVVILATVSTTTYIVGSSTHSQSTTLI